MKLYAAKGPHDGHGDAENYFVCYATYLVVQPACDAFGRESEPVCSPGED